MSQTPLDGRDREADEGDSHGADEERGSLLDTVVGVTRSAIAATLAAVRGIAVPGPGTSLDGTGRDDHPIVQSDGGGTDDEEVETTKPVVSDHSDTRPVPARTDDGPRDRPELVARWHDDRLTLSEPDEAGAQISSDTWSEVDP